MNFIKPVALFILVLTIGFTAYFGLFAPASQAQVVNPTPEPPEVVPDPCEFISTSAFTLKNCTDILLVPIQPNPKVETYMRTARFWCLQSRLCASRNNAP